MPKRKLMMKRLMLIKLNKQLTRQKLRQMPMPKLLTRKTEKLQMLLIKLLLNMKKHLIRREVLNNISWLLKTKSKLPRKPKRPQSKLKKLKLIIKWPFCKKIKPNTSKKKLKWTFKDLAMMMKLLKMLSNK